MNSIKSRVLVAPLNWGLGHATRCIPVIKSLLKLNCEVLISANGGGKIILRQEFPHLNFVDIPGTEIRYPAKGSMLFSMLMQIPSILNSIKTEHRVLNKVIDQHKITHVISDNRYGLYSSKVKTAFITHQVNIKSNPSLKFLEPVLKKVNQKYIEKFDALWIPDLPLPYNLSGSLSDAGHIKIPVRHIGILSRFEKVANGIDKKYDIIALLSGPEPQRSQFESKLLNAFRESSKKCLLVQGLPGTKKQSRQDKIEVVNSISSDELSIILHPDTLFISRPGYSTIMDLAVLGHQRILFIPTPEQTEQEYLAKRMNKIYGVAVTKQGNSFPDADEILDSKFNFLQHRVTDLANCLHGFLSDSKIYIQS